MRTKKMKNSTSGITLIALIITIIVLLILAGVSLAMLTGDSGILTNAENAKKNTLDSNAKEQLALAVQEAIIEARKNGTSEIDAGKLKSALDRITGVEHNITGEAPWTVTINGKSFTVTKNGVIEGPDNKKYIDCVTCGGDGSIEKYKCDQHDEEEYSIAKPGLYITYVCSNNSAPEHTGDQRRNFSY